MALTESNIFESGKIAPHFELLDTVSGEFKNLNKLKGTQGTVILFICNHCPYVVHINDGLVKVATEYISKGINFIAISSNDATAYPQDGPEQMKQVALKLEYPFPYLYDKSQAVAKAYGATCTPDIYLFDQELKAVYHGQLDDSRPGSGRAVTGADLREAMDKLLSGEELVQNPKPSIGCSIKWR